MAEVAEAAATAILIASGLATRYNPFVMDAVVRNRIKWHQLPPGTDSHRCVALLDACEIGRQVWLEHPDGRIIGPVIVADCAQSVHKGMLRRRKWAVDLSYELAVELGVIHRPMKGFKVWDRDPRSTRNVD